jgi:flavin-dependent dehydrogenase
VDELQSSERGDEQVVVGAGPGGQALARQLKHQRGIDALVVDRATAPTFPPST